MMPARRLITALALCCGLLSLLPGSAAAAQVFGSRLVDQPANSGECSALMQACTLVAYIHPLPGSGDPYSGGAPSDGVLTKVRLRARVDENPTQVTFLLANLTPSGSSATASIAARGPTVTLQPTETVEEATGSTPIAEFDLRMPVRKGQQLAIDGTDVQATHNDSGQEFTYVFAPPLMPGVTSQALEATGELLIQGTIEPDADGDGFGDETQDQCPSQATTQGPCDTSAPQVTGFRVRHGRIAYALAEPTTVAFRLAKKVGRRFKPQGKTFAGPGTPGPHRLSLPRARKLRTGVYRLSLTATDTVGNAATYTARFRIRAHRRQPR